MSDGLQILVVDDETDLLEVYASYLVKAGFKVETASDGGQAVAHLEKTDFFLVITDARMPTMHGAALIKWIKTNRPQMKIILATGFSQLAETVSADSLGCVAVLSKPVKKDDLLNAVKLAEGQLHSEKAEIADDAPKNTASTKVPLNANKPKGTAPKVTEPKVTVQKESAPEKIAFAEKQSSDVQDSPAPGASSTGKDFAVVSLDTYIPKENISGDFYIQSETGLTKAGELSALRNDSIAALKKKKINAVYIENKDFDKYLELVRISARAAPLKPGLDDASRRLLVKHSLELAAENLRIFGIGKETIEIGEKTVTEALSPLLNKVSELVSFKQFEFSNNYFADHSAATAMLTCVVAKIMGWTAVKNINAVCLGAYFHDLGLLEMPEELWTKNYFKMTDEEQKLYRKHPTMGAKKLAEFDFISDDVLKIVHQHHEIGGTSGYPQNLARNKIFPTARVVMLVDIFAETMFKLQSAGANPQPLAVLDKVLSTKEYVGLDQPTAIALGIAFKESDFAKAQRLYANQVSKKGA